MPEYDLNFSSLSTDEAGSYKLIELPPDLTALIEDAIAKDEDLRFPFSITRRSHHAHIVPTALPLKDSQTKMRYYAPQIRPLACAQLVCRIPFSS